MKEINDFNTFIEQSLERAAATVNHKPERLVLVREPGRQFFVKESEIRKYRTSCGDFRDKNESLEKQLATKEDGFWRSLKKAIAGFCT